MNTDPSLVERSTIRENKLDLVERLADDLAHEIKNPLHSMVINLEVLRRRLTRLNGASRDDLLRYASVLNSELERVNSRVDLLLRMLRPNREPDEPTTLPEVIGELRELMDLECERHDVSFQLDLPAGLMATRLPRAATRQMILSLVLEMLDSLEPGGSLRIGGDLEERSLHLRVEGTPGTAALPAQSTFADDAYLQVAHALAQCLDARLEVLSARSETNLESGPERAFVLSIPRG